MPALWLCEVCLVVYVAYNPNHSRSRTVSSRPSGASEFLAGQTGNRTCGSDSLSAERNSSSSLCAHGKWILQSSIVLYKLNAYDMQFTYCRFHFPCDPDSYQRQFQHWIAQDVGMQNGSSIKLNKLVLKALLSAHQL